jgi:hypothetical protein
MVENILIQSFVLLSFFLWLIAILGIGSFISGFFEKYFKKFRVNKIFRFLYFSLLGYSSLAVLGTIANFFVPLNGYFSIPLLLVGLILFYVNRKNICEEMDKIDWTVIFVFFLFCGMFTLMSLKNYDTGLYHLPVINWIYKEALPFGLANLHGRFGFNSSWFVLSAIINPLRFVTQHPFFIINATLFFFYGSFVLLTVVKVIKKFKANVSEIFALTTIIPGFFSLQSFISSPSPDLPAMLLTFFVTYLLIKAFILKKIDYLFIAFIASFFAVTVKISTVPYFFGILFVLVAIFFRKYILKKEIGFFKNINFPKYILAFLAVLLLGIPYLARGFVSSGYPAYPSTIGHINVNWAVSETGTASEANWVKSWARKPHTPPEEVLGNWDWFREWLFKFIKGQEVFLIFLLSGLLAFGICVYFKKKKFISSFLAVSLLSFFGCLFWFFSAPTPRFGYGYLFSFAGVFIAFGLYNLFLDKKVKHLAIGIVVFLLLGSFIFSYGKYGIMEIFNLKKIKQPALIEKETKDSVIIYVPQKGDQCSNAPLLSTPYFNDKLKIEFNNKEKPRKFWVEN